MNKVLLSMWKSCWESTQHGVEQTSEQWLEGLEHGALAKPDCA